MSDTLDKNKDENNRRALVRMGLNANISALMGSGAADGTSDVAAQIRRLLAASTFNSLSANVETGTIMHLVTRGVWSPEEGLLIATHMPDEVERAITLGGLSVVLSPEYAQQAAALTLDTLKGVKADYPRAQSLALVAPCVPDHLHGDMLAIAGSIHSSVDRVLALAACAACMRETNRQTALREALAALHEISHRGEYERALGRFAHMLPRDMQNSVPSEFRRAEPAPEAEGPVRLMLEIAEEVHEPVRSGLLNRALHMCEQIGDARGRLWLLVLVLSRFPDEQPPALPSDPVRDFLPRGSDGQQRAEQAATLVRTFLPEGKGQVAVLAYLASMERGECRSALVEHALHRSEQILDPLERAQCLCKIVPLLPRSERPALVDQALVLLEAGKVPAAGAYYPHRPSPSDYALEMMAFEASVAQRCLALAQLARAVDEPLKGPLFARSLAGLQEIRDLPGESTALRPAVEERATIVARLAPLLPAKMRDDLLDKTLHQIQALQSRAIRRDVLEKLAPALSPERLRQVLDITNTIGDYAIRTRAIELLEVAGQGHEPHVTSVMDWLKRQVQKRQPGSASYGASSASSPRSTGSTGSTSHPANNLLGVGDGPRRLADEEVPTPELIWAIQEQLAEAKRLGSDYDRMGLLLRAIESMPVPSPQLVEQALGVMRSMSSESFYAEVLEALGPRLSDPYSLAEQTVQIVLDMRDSDYQASALSTLVPLLPADMQRQYLRMGVDAALQHHNFIVPSHQDKFVTTNRSQDLQHLIPALMACDTVTLQALWKRMLPRMAAVSRRDLLADLVALAPVIERLGGPGALADMQQAIREVGNLWP